ncbi:hypothetical protein VTI74DRAFT_9676 [Chaetomium olivicolor]
MPSAPLHHHHHHGASKSHPARPNRLLLTGASLLSLASPASTTFSSTFQFSSCVDICITSSGCETSSTKCMCISVRGLFLESVITCMFFNCKTDLPNFKAAFLDPIEEICDDVHRDIPGRKIKAAESLASSLVEELPASTTAAAGTSTVVEFKPTPTPTTTASPTRVQRLSSFSSSSTVPTTKTETEVSSSTTTAADSVVDTSPTSSDAPLPSSSSVAVVPPAVRKQPKPKLVQGIPVLTSTPTPLEARQPRLLGQLRSRRHCWVLAYFLSQLDWALAMAGSEVEPSLW